MGGTTKRAAVGLALVTACVVLVSCGSGHRDSGELAPYRPGPGGGEVSDQVSTSWAGYCVTGGPFRSVTATWTEPTLTPPPTSEYTQLSCWVGLDGYSTHTVEQIGTRGWARGGDKAGVWWRAFLEMWPRRLFNISWTRSAYGRTRFVFAPGDTMKATVVSLGRDRFRVTLENVTRGMTFTAVRSCPHSRSTSAEIIVELLRRSTMEPAQFAPVQFTACAVDGRPLDVYGPTRISMVSGSGMSIAKVSALESDGTSFTVSR